MTQGRFSKRTKRPPIRARRAIAPAPRAGAAVGALLRPLRAKYGPGVSDIEARWEEIVGPRVAKRCRPIALSGRGERGVLKVAAPGPAAMLVEADAARILEQVNAFCGRAVAGRLAITRASARTANVAKVAPSMAPPSYFRQIEDTLGTVADPKLRQALARLGRGVANSASKTDRKMS